MTSNYKDTNWEVKCNNCDNFDWVEECPKNAEDYRCDDCGGCEGGWRVEGHNGDTQYGSDGFPKNEEYHRKEIELGGPVIYCGGGRWKLGEPCESEDESEDEEEKKPKNKKKRKKLVIIDAPPPKWHEKCSKCPNTKHDCDWVYCLQNRAYCGDCSPSSSCDLNYCQACNR